MVAYCCVKGCSHNSSNKKKDPNDVTSFHAFPTNVELKQKWLRAIGRPNWAPPGYARVCSSHFSYEQINHDGQRVRIKEDAVPVKELPVNSNFEASHVEVCRFCLATDLKLYSLQTGLHRLYLESIMECNENYKIDGLPQFICFECAAHLKKCYNLLEKSMVAQATLLDIFAHNGKISKKLIKLKNREELHLTSSLSIKETKSVSLHIKHDISEFVDIESNEIEDINSDENLISILKIEVMDFGIECNDVKEDKYEEFDINIQGNVAHSNIKPDDNSNYENDTDTDFVYNDTKVEITDIAEDKKFESHKRRSKQAKTNKNDGLTPDEINMQNYFTIVQLSLEEQIEEWNSTKINKKFTGDSFKCETCFKVFAHHTSYRLHTAGHDPSRGPSECAVCKLRFKNDVLARSHANRVHAKKFYCKTCPKTFSNVGVAKKHHKWHSGFTYKCGSCAFSTAHASALGAHARAAHAARACARCGHAFISLRGLRLHMAAAHRGEQDELDPKYECEQCGLSFTSEGARRVHVLTSKQHKKNTASCDTTFDQSLKNTCSKCGVEFSSPKELVEHRRAEHRRVKKKTSWSLPDDRYPTQCEHCGIEISCRKEHWSHVRSRHPAARAAYRPVVTAVCHTCGKGFQNSTKLRLHSLRHGPPTAPCAQCGRLFHDKHALGRHAAAHGPRAHRCACGRAFRHTRHLARHQRVHTGETPYECSICGKKFKYSTSLNLHVKTIHYRLPHPPRKKRIKSTSEDDSSKMQ